MTRPHFASRVEDKATALAGSLLTSRAWRSRIFAYTGYASVDPVLEGRDRSWPKTASASVRAGSSVPQRRRVPDGGMARVLGRVVLTRRDPLDLPPTHPMAPISRGFSAFVTVPQPGQRVSVEFGQARAETTTDRGGYIDVTLTGHGLTQGWHEATIRLGDLEQTAAMQVIGSKVRFGIISDIDDTALITSLPRPLIAAWNTFVVRETVRRPVPGMAALYRTMRATHDGTAMFYLSTGAWNTQPVLSRFMRRNGFPQGTMLLTDWGPTTTSWFRSGRDHKRQSLRRLAREFPHIKWLLVGDDGQHDPSIYEEFAREYPKNVAAVCIRELTPAQQLLSHGHPLSLDEVTRRVPGVAWFEGPNGFELHASLEAVDWDA